MTGEGGAGRGDVLGTPSLGRQSDQRFCEPGVLTGNRCCQGAGAGGGGGSSLPLPVSPREGRGDAAGTAGRVPAVLRGGARHGRRYVRALGVGLPSGPRRARNWEQGTRSGEGGGRRCGRGAGVASQVGGRWKAAPGLGRCTGPALQALCPLHSAQRIAPRTPLAPGRGPGPALRREVSGGGGRGDHPRGAQHPG